MNRSDEPEVSVRLKLAPSEDVALGFLTFVGYQRPTVMQARRLISILVFA